MTYDSNDIDLRVARLEAALVKHDGIVIAELDGFLTALWLLPKEAPADQWMPFLFSWRKDDGAGPDLELAKLIAEHYNSVGFELRSGTYQPIYMAPDDEADDTIIWEPWIEGFGGAIGLFPDAFEPLVAAEDDAGEMFRMLIALAGVAMKDPDMTADMGEETVAELAAAAPDLIPECVHTLYETKLETSGALQPRSASTVGRNDPCPCGSGKKYKKCCGAAN